MRPLACRASPKIPSPEASISFFNLALPIFKFMPGFEHRTNKRGGSFTYEADGKKLAEMVYFNSGDSTIIIDHTDVDASLKGQGIGKQLLGHLVEFVRENHKLVIPYCPFANATFQKTPEWQDVLSKILMKPQSRMDFIRQLFHKNKVE